ncbi:ABC transporter permease [Alkalihalobacillus alcalophilus ATCC 27647 = CGMCC 1.3604]|uniref:ABC transporter permease n=2 Tax=Alkalihalobacillus alcalophilus ATCC 27647 = CGMCC 1.3604 TaxID=1218173 RepID=A0A094WL60_ALKAL|nr:ABC transporter permease [Alkalihalobacillus alcalophilus]KGA98489.1 ABC transporter permease [Alkalihalobacillus alcalophilus ATCC 27647 = CGMCC 1.3604]MED1562921.1 ABC transporter permease [Alkalihalobacillus alcalophilus]THG91735.1 ABC transporter permease [Alkalihalobacillus alcalophilus ATCC 27647 = CGMCC 1.3604]
MNTKIKFNRWLSAGGLIFFLLLGWEASAQWVNQPYLFPSPSQIFIKMIDLHHVLFFVHLPATLSVMLIGLFCSMILGVALALCMNKFKTLEQAIYPILIVSQTIPIIALAPVFVLWFGYSIWSKVLVTILITFFPITVNTFDGLKSTSKEQLEWFKTAGASKRAILTKLYIPSALPSFFSGMKVAITLSVIGAAIGEWLGANAGLGYFSRRMMTQFDGAGVFAPIVWLSILGLIGFLLITLLEYYLLKWRHIK